MNLLTSVVICTHNPRSDYLGRALVALRNQTLPFQHWELLLIDNASTQPLASTWDLSWHPNARCVLEEELGLAHARLRAIKESCGELIVFVDDDNVLAADYLECAVQIATARPYIGAFGGSVKGEFETTPEPWASPYLHWLSIREIHRDSWSNLMIGWNDSSPYGAGLCVRRSVAQDYLQKALGDSKRRALGRVGTGTGSAEDTDLAYCAIDLGMGIGSFHRLKLTHLIAKKRLTVDYIARLNAGIQASSQVLKSLRPSTSAPSRPSRLAGILFWAKLATSSRNHRKIALATRAGLRSGQKFVMESSTDLSLIQH
jgi:glycosyltransferase involved in cell wall biosynthesis